MKCHMDKVKSYRYARDWEANILIALNLIELKCKQMKSGHSFIFTQLNDGYLPSK